MLNENIRTIRKNKGFTQEELANRLNVARQTVSKWEKGYSVPDADILAKMAEELDVSVSELLGAEEIPSQESDSLSKQLARINEQLSIRNKRSKRIWKTVIVLLFVFFVIIPGTLAILYSMGSANLRGADTGFEGSTEWVYSLDGAEYEYRVEYDKKYRVIATGGDTYIEENVDIESCEDANEVGERIAEYFEKHGGRESKRGNKAVTS